MEKLKRFLTSREPRWLLFGDFLAIVIITMLGFASHNTLGTAGARMLTTLLPWLAGWLLVAPWMGLFEREITEDTRQLWRPFWAMALASPIAAYLRGLMLGRPSTLVFVPVMIGVAGIVMTLWRGGYAWLKARGNRDG